MLPGTAPTAAAPTLGSGALADACFSWEASSSSVAVGVSTAAPAAPRGGAAGVPVRDDADAPDTHDVADVGAGTDAGAGADVEERAEGGCACSMLGRERRLARALGPARGAAGHDSVALAV